MNNEMTINLDQRFIDIMTSILRLVIELQTEGHAAKAAGDHEKVNYAFANMCMLDEFMADATGTFMKLVPSERIEYLEAFFKNVREVKLSLGDQKPNFAMRLEEDTHGL